VKVIKEERGDLNPPSPDLSPLPSPKETQTDDDTWEMPLYAAKLTNEQQKERYLKQVALAYKILAGLTAIFWLWLLFLLITGKGKDNGCLVHCFQ